MGENVSILQADLNKVNGGSAPSPDDTAAGSSREPREEGQYNLLGVQVGPLGHCGLDTEVVS